MTVQQLKCLCAVVKFGNFTNASEELYLSQSTVSKSILALENTVGFKLIERQGRKSALTKDGKKLMADIWDIMASYDHLQGIVDDINTISTPTLTQSLRLCSVPAIDELGMVNDISTFMESYPQDLVALNVMEENQVLAALSTHDCDLAFCSDISIDKNLFETYHYRKQYFSIFVSRNHPLAQKEAVALKELAPYGLIFSGRESMLLSLCTKACTDTGFEPRLLFTTNRPGIALGYIKNTDYAYMGLNVSYPTLDTSLCRKIPLLNGPTFNYILAHRRDIPLSRSAKHFISHICSSEQMP